MIDNQPTEGKTNDRRYFYTDPLAAAWMAHRHNLRIEHNPRFCSYNESGDFCTVIKIYHSEPGQPRFYVHPDSLHLLEPQVGDVIDLPTAPKATRSLLIHNGEEFSDNFLSKHEGWRIIQRNRDVFHWPEAETAESSGQ